MKPIEMRRNAMALPWRRRAMSRLGLLAGLLLGVFVIAASAAEAKPPFLAIWQDEDGQRPESGAPYLRIAIWDDGRVLFTTNPHKWRHTLREGRITVARVAVLKKAVEATGVFELPGYCYLVPDSAVNCLMVDVGTKRQMLYWDEVEQPNYGLNIDPKPHHRKFMACWKAVNRLALEAVPGNSNASAEAFARPPASWRFKPPIQSE